LTNTNNVSFNLKFALQQQGVTGALFSRTEIESVTDRVTKEMERLEQSRGKGPLAFLDVPYAYNPEHGPTVFGDTFLNTLPTIRQATERIHSIRGQFLHVGIGGSALGAITLKDALGETKEMGYESPAEVFVPDNVDPDWIAQIMHRLDFRRVYIHVISKSGGTTETIATFALFWEKMLQESGLSLDELRARVFVTTNPDAGPLADLARSQGFTLLPLPDAIHGRFSVFSPMGLFAGAVAGVNIDELLAGARAADQETAQAPFWQNPVQQLAALHYLGLTRKGLSILVLLPYSNRLRTVADWYSQLVAESLGKNRQGMTPVKALGVTDQHSQLQLYNDGPKDKLIVFFSVKQHADVLRMPESIAENPDYAYLANKTLNELLKAELEATEVSLHLHGVPSCHFELSELNAFNVGYLLTVLEKTVCILGALLGVNAFDQPGVEESKEYARAMLGKEGPQYDTLRQRVAELSGD
jgi:glucose-6-phosphate isomerase